MKSLGIIKHKVTETLSQRIWSNPYEILTFPTISVEKTEFSQCPKKESTQLIQIC